MAKASIAWRTPFPLAFAVSDYIDSDCNRGKLLRYIAVETINRRKKGIPSIHE